MDAPIRDPESSNLTPSEIAQVPSFSEKLPSIEETLQMARLAMMVYEERPIDAFKDAAKASAKAPKDDKDAAKEPKDDKDPALAKILKRLAEEGGTDLEMWYYECNKEGTEAILTFSPKKNRCTVVFRGTEVGGEAADALWASLKDIKSDLSGLKVPFGPNKEEDDPSQECRVHQGFRGQYYGEVSEFRNDGAVHEDLRADDGPDGSLIKGMVLETALLQKVEKVLKFQDEKKISDTKLFVTGHSLGAALSVLFGIRLAHKYPERDVQVINFGCPKVGNAAFAQLVNTKANLCVQRVAHKQDVITRAPNLLYNHVGHTIQIGEAAEPHAFKWHASCSFWTNWNPFFGLLQGGVGDHSMIKYVAALNSHQHGDDGCTCETTGEKSWVAAYKE